MLAPTVSQRLAGSCMCLDVGIRASLQQPYTILADSAAQRRGRGNQKTGNNKRKNTGGFQLLPNISRGAKRNTDSAAIAWCTLIMPPGNSGEGGDGADSVLPLSPFVPTENPNTAQRPCLPAPSSLQDNLFSFLLGHHLGLVWSSLGRKLL